MDQPSHLRALQALELALRTGSLKGAAEHLAITPAAVGQRVKALEDYLGVDLLLRGRSGLQPTAELVGALPHLHTAFRELAQAAELLELQRGQRIRIAAASDIVDLWLTPKLPTFRAQHPNIALEINGEGDLPRRLAAADCELFFGPVGSERSPDERRGDLLFHDLVLPVTSPENERRVAALGGPTRLEGFPLLHVDFYRDDPRAPRWSDWLASQGLTRTAPERGIRFHRIAPALDALTANAGFALCGMALLREAIAAGLLSLPFPLKSGRRTSHAFQVRFRAETLQRPQVRRFRQWLLAEAAETRRWLDQGAAEPDPR
jgi:LysR family glycine cleavage system transcriptional activator